MCFSSGRNLLNYSNLVKFEHSIFALPFAVTSYFLVTGSAGYSHSTFLTILIAMISARVFAMTLNRLIDKQIDGLNPRTQNRELPTGMVSIKEAYLILLSSITIFLFSLLQFNPICWLLSPIVIAVMTFYPYTKRFTWLCHLCLGLIYFIIPPAVSIALTGRFSLSLLLLGIGGLFWVMGFDILYGILDLDNDRKNKLKSIPVKFGLPNSIAISRFSHFVTLIFLLLIGLILGLHLFYWIGISIVIILFIWEHSLIKANDLSKLNFSFFTMNGLISIIFSIFTVSDILIL